MTDWYEDVKKDMNLVLDVLRKEKRKMTDSELCDFTGLSREKLETALSMLLTRNLIRCDSFNPSKRGGQAGVNIWGGSSYTALWEAIEEDNDHC